MTKPVAAKFKAASTQAMPIPQEVSYLDPGLTRMSDEQAECMSEGHLWPRLRLNKPVPKGFNSFPNDDGTNQWVWVCQSCGTTRSRTTLKYGIYDEGATFSYVYPPSWIHFTLEDEMSRARIKRDRSKRMYGYF